MTSVRRRGKKEKKRIHFRVGRVIPLFLLLCIVGYIVYTYIGFSEIRSEDILKSSNSNYFLLSDKKDALEKTLIVFEEEYNEKEVIKYVYLYAVNKEKGKAVLIFLPGRLEYKGLEKDFGTPVFVSSFKHAGEFLQQGRGYEYAIWQIEQLLGSNIDQYIWFSPEAFNIFQEKLGESSGDSVYAQYYTNGFDVNDEAFFLNSFVSRLDWVNLLMSSSKFRDSQAVIYSSLPTLGNVMYDLKGIQRDIFSLRPYLIDFSSVEYLIQEESADGGVQTYIDTKEYDTVWRGFVDSMVDRELEKERGRVEVYNGSGLSGYASQYARRVRNSGIEVVRYDNAPDEEEKTKFYIPNPEDFPITIQIIQEIFPGSYETIKGRPSL